MFLLYLSVSGDLLLLCRHEQKKAAYVAEKQETEQKMRKLLEQVTDHKMYIHNNLRQVERHTTQLQQQIEESL